MPALRCKGLATKQHASAAQCLALLGMWLAGCVSAAPSAEPPGINVTGSPTIAAPSATPSAPAATQASTPTPSSVRISPVDGLTQVFVPAGRFTMGGVDVYAENDELPAHTVQLDAFWLDQVEVTTGMYGLCVRAGACGLPAKTHSDNRASYFENVEFRDYPVVYVTWQDAQEYCSWAGRRLPTEAEWERAARGDDLRTYPWGDEPPNELLANFLNLAGDTSRVGSYASGASPFGALDMAGNVWEWVADIYKRAYYEESPAANPSGPSDAAGLFRVIRGGSFQDARVNVRVSNRGYELGPNLALPFSDATRRGNASVRIGFRCAVDS